MPNASSASLPPIPTSSSFTYSLVSSDILHEHSCAVEMTVLGNSLPITLASRCLQLTQTWSVQSLFSIFCLSAASTDFYIFPFLPYLPSLSQLSAPQQTIHQHTPSILFCSSNSSTFLSSYENFVRDFFSYIFISDINPIHGSFLKHHRYPVIHVKQMNGLCSKQT